MGPSSAYEMMPESTAEQNTPAGFVEKIERQYGGSERNWIMDRGINAHTYISFIAYCILVTLKNLARPRSGGLTPCPVIGTLPYQAIASQCSSRFAFSLSAPFPSSM